MRDSRKKHTPSFYYLGLLLTALLIVQISFIYAANSKLSRIRCHRYDEGGHPVKVRMSLDFSAKPERLNLFKSDSPLRGVPSGFVEDFIIRPSNPGAGDVIGKAEIKYGNTNGMLNVRIEDNSIHVAIQKEYELQQSKFNYLDANKVAYIDLKIIKRKVTPVPKPVAKPAPAPKPAPSKLPAKVVPKPVPKVPVSTGISLPIPVKALPALRKTAVAKPDTVYLEKIIYDTVYVKVGGKKETSPDTIYVEKIVYVTVDDAVNRIGLIKVAHYLHWWNNPQFIMDFNFSLKYEELALKKTSQRTKGMPEGYNVQFVIYPKDKKIRNLFENIPVDYVRCSDKIIVFFVKSKCYILAKKGYTFKPDKIKYDKKRHTASLRLSY